jgi:uncharacterized protein YcbK (DUF882 family)
MKRASSLRCAAALAMRWCASLISGAWSIYGLQHLRRQERNAREIKAIHMDGYAAKFVIDGFAASDVAWSRWV